MTLDEWWHSGFDPTPVRIPRTTPQRDPAKSVLKWSGGILVAMLIAPFYLFAVFAKSFIRI